MTIGIAHLSCRELVELVTEYLEGALSRGEENIFNDVALLSVPLVIWLQHAYLPAAVVAPPPAASPSSLRVAATPAEAHVWVGKPPGEATYLYTPFAPEAPSWGRCSGAASTLLVAK